MFLTFSSSSLKKWLTSHWTFVLQTGWVTHHDHPNQIICTRLSSVMLTKGQCIGGKMSSFRIAKSPTTEFLRIPPVHLPRFLTWSKCYFGHRFQKSYTCFCIYLKHYKRFSGIVETSGLGGNMIGLLFKK